MVVTLHVLLAGSALAERGALVQLGGTDGCISNDGTGGECTKGVGLAGALDVTITADDAGLYVASFSSDAVAALSRNERKADGPIGKLTQAAGESACVSEAGGGPCTDGKGLLDPFAVAVSQDGKSVYVAGAESNAVAVFARDRETNVLQQLAGSDGCVSQDGSNGDCGDGRGLDRPVGLAVPRDGNQVYATAGDSTSIAVLARNERPTAPLGVLSQVACLSATDGECTEQPNLSAAIGVKTSPDGRHLYVVAQGDGAVLAFKRNAKTGALTPLAGLDACVSRDGSGGACTPGRGLLGARAIAVSRDGRNVYVASEFGSAVAIFARDRKTGALRQLEGLDGCVAEGGIPGVCAAGKALLSTRGVTVSRDGRNVYVASPGSDAVAVFARDRRTGKLAQLPGTAGCVSETGTSGACADGKALRNAGAVAVSNDGKSVYVASFTSGAVAVFARQGR
jgi:DNA-binding beta-propeller fold protein YncE